MRKAPAIRFLALGELYFGDERVRIQTVLGTCVAITLWHPVKRLGGMCHYLLPSRGDGRGGAHTAPAVYGDEAMNLFLTAIRRGRTQPGEYQVKLFGGGSMFSGHWDNPQCLALQCEERSRPACPSIGCRNVQAGREMLAQHGFSIVAHDVGGQGSRNVTFDVWSGDVWVRRGEPLDGTVAECA